MKVGVIGIGEMGFPMAGHVRDKGYAVTVYDVDEGRLGAAKDAGFDTASSLAELATKAEIFIAVVNTDEQSREVTEEISKNVGSLLMAPMCMPFEATLVMLSFRQPQYSARLRASLSQ